MKHSLPRGYVVAGAFAAALLCSQGTFAAAGTAPAAAVEEPRLESALGREVTPPKGVEGGRIIDVLINAEGQIRAYVVEFGGFLGIGTRKIAVEAAAFRFEGQKIYVDVTGDQLQAAREYNAKEPTPFVVAAASRRQP